MSRAIPTLRRDLRRPCEALVDVENSVQQFRAMLLEEAVAFGFGDVTLGELLGGVTEFTRLVSAAVFQDSATYAGLYYGSVLGERYKNVALFESTHREVRSSFHTETSRRLEYGDPDLKSALEFLGLSLDLTTNSPFGFAL